MFQGTYHVRKIKMELVLLREFSTIEPQEAIEKV